MRKTILAAFLSAAVAAAFTSMALAVPVVMTTQGDAPVQLQSCSAALFGNSVVLRTTPQVVSGTVMEGSHIVATGPNYTTGNDTVTEVVGSASTSVFGSAEAVNRSVKAVTGVVYEFDVINPANETIATFFGPRTGKFTQNIRITPYGTGAMSTWSTTLTQPKVSVVRCFVAYVQFADGSSWTSPLAKIPDQSPAAKR